MKTNVTQYDFVNWFSESEARKDQFSREALFALYDYLIEYEKSIDEDLDFDPIALCCDYTEYKTAWGAMEEYMPEDMPIIEDSEGMDLVELRKKQEQEALEWLIGNTIVIIFDGGIIVQNF